MTPKQERVLHAMEAWWRRTRRMPTLQQLAGVVGTKTRSSVWRHVRALESAGHVTVRDGRWQFPDRCPTCGAAMTRR